MQYSTKRKRALLVALFGVLVSGGYIWYSLSKGSRATAADLLRYEGLLADEKIGVDGVVDNTVAMQADEGVVFLKTHKTGGTTLVNILWRNLCEPVRSSSGSRKARNCFLSPIDHPGKTWDFHQSSHWEVLERQGGSSLYGRDGRPPYEVWLSHAKYHESLLSKLVPSAKRVISIVRNPAQRFKSAWHWYQHEKTTGLSMAEYLSLVESGRSPPALEYRKGLDATIEELVGQEGFSASSGGTSSSINIEQLDALVDGIVERVRSGKLLLLVTERFDESLLVLSKLMRLDGVGQLAYIRLKDRRSGVAYRADRLDSPESASGEDLHLDTRLAALQPHDSFVYKLANRVLDNLLSAWFPDAAVLSQSIRQLEEANAKLADKCTKGGTEQLKFMGTPCHCFVRDNNHTVRSAWAALEGHEQQEPSPLHCIRDETQVG